MVNIIEESLGAEDKNIVIEPLQKPDEIHIDNVVNEERTDWNEITTDDLVDSFGDYILYQQEEFKQQFDTKQFSSEIFDEDYWAEKFPHFDERVHELLANLSKAKIVDLRKQNDIFKKLNENIRPFKEQ